MKRLKREVNVTTLPDQVIELIQFHAGRKSVVSLSSVNKSYRTSLEKFVFDCLKTTWYNLQNNEFQMFLEQRKSFITSMRFIDTYSYGEWQIDVFEGVLNKLPQLQTFVVNSFNSSNWLKYRASTTIRRMEMHYDYTHNETHELYENPNPKNINRLSRSSQLPKIFSLHHLCGFPRLSDLTLTDYHFNWDEKMDSLNVQFLHLKNCTWEYPFTPAKFNENNSLITFGLTYTHDHAFLLSERFDKFVNEPFQIGCKINKLAVVIQCCERPHYLSFNKVKMFLNRNIFPDLEELDLSGWAADFKTLHRYLVAIGDVPVKSLKVSLGELEHKSRIRFNEWPHLKIESRIS
ncbi:hypothetical protein PSN45_003426 [Yamadazyma tenuis]|uniref:F-box domain-containing protein n=1 Tax=Candida tenuis (strain ATCC 10573 / BCRC 21748 / CBS 615 / JCM 9827 / NBRC 10315 / NRRL Y-1498 / VKM Y-70) TaxID=590646 RepID=G3AY70_CANTC|nr:uncharacterized protein CANTEDRAFT_118463 [Yamadazyma tenuis ATCC 10573]EGV65780.1 hypothetical protein CANTEDRAFT_118463 [Yamadazyma tenuis ATCC 10573]WEJ95895.1 hypothetical protein PSN45_003426 [Yamadazyma tenuis]